MAIRFSEYRMADVQAKLNRAGFRPLDVMVTGVTGAGKSTTMNALLQNTVAKVGDGVDPETMNIDYYELNDIFRLWDTPGLGDGVEIDKRHKSELIRLLHKTYSHSYVDYGFIDMVLVIIEGANRDMGTTYTLLNEVIVPHIQRDRILVVINQADVAMKGRHWDRIQQQPDAQLLQYLDQQALSIQARVKEAMGVEILKPVYYSAEYGYNLQKMCDFIIDHMPTERRKLMK